MDGKERAFPLPAHLRASRGRGVLLTCGWPPRPDGALREDVPPSVGGKFALPALPCSSVPPFVLITRVRTAGETRNRFLLQPRFLELIIQTDLLQTFILFLEMALLLTACSPVVLYRAADLL